MERITETRLKKLGFEYHEYNGPPFEIWKKQDIGIWNWNGKHWLVEALDQAGIDREFKYMCELNLFFCACGKNLYL